MRLERLPYYDLDKVKSLVSDGAYSLRNRAQRFLFNRYNSTSETVRGIFSSIKEEDYRKTVELVKHPGVKADVYMPQYDGMTWFVKFCFREGAVSAVVDIWSCNWDSVIH